MAEAFIPVYTPDPALRSAQQRMADAVRATPLDPVTRVKDFTAQAGGTYRVAATAGTITVTLPTSGPSNYGKTVTLFVIVPNVDVIDGTTVVANLTAAGMYMFGSDGGY